MPDNKQPPSRAGNGNNNEAQERANKLSLAYAVVFGQEGTRTEAQKLVWESMEHRAYMHRSTAVPFGQGEVQANKMEIAEGMRCFHLDTRYFLERAKRLGSEQQKPNIKR